MTAQPHKPQQQTSRSRINRAVSRLLAAIDKAIRAADEAKRAREALRRLTNQADECDDGR